MDFLTNLNTNLNAEHIRNILSHLGERKLPTRKAEMAQRLNQVWLEAPSRLLNALSEPERLLLAECAHSEDPEPDVARLNAKHGFSYSIPHHGSWRDHHVVLCLLARDDRWSYELVDGVIDKLKSLLPSPPALKIASVAKLPEEGQWTFSMWAGEKRHDTRAIQCHESERTALLEAKRMLQLTAADKLRVSDKTCFPTPATQKTVGEALCAPDLNLILPEGNRQPWQESDTDPGPVRSFAWPVLLQQCGWAKSSGAKLVLTRKGKALLDDFNFERYREGVLALVRDSMFDELRRVSVLKGQRGKRAGRGRIPVECRRSAIFACLRAMPTNAWVMLEEAYRVLYALGEDGRAYGDGMSLYIHEFQYGHLSGHETEIGRVYFRQFLGESLTTLGVVDIGYAYPHYLHPELHGCWGLDDEPYVTRYDGVKYLRLTPLGRFCLGVDKTYDPPEQQQRTLFKVLPNMEIVVTDAAAFSTADAAMLDRFARRVSDSIWRLNAKTVIAALESGDRAEDILITLRDGSGIDIPDTVQRLVKETATRAGAAADREDAVIVTFRDEETAALVVHDTAAGKAVLCREGACVVVRVRKLKAFQSALRKLGILLP